MHSTTSAPAHEEPDPGALPAAINRMKDRRRQKAFFSTYPFYKVARRASEIGAIRRHAPDLQSPHHSTMKNTILLLTATCLAPILFNACSSTSGAGGWGGYGSGTNNAANPYGVPRASGEPGSYPSGPSYPATNPYQPYATAEQAAAPSNAATAATPVEPAAPVANSTTHTVVAGDSLWGIARKHGTTVEAIQTANGLTSTVIRVGETLTIPGN